MPSLVIPLMIFTPMSELSSEEVVIVLTYTPVPLLMTLSVIFTPTSLLSLEEVVIDPTDIPVLPLTITVVLVFYEPLSSSNLSELSS